VNDVSNFELHDQNRLIRTGLRRSKRWQYHRPLEGRGKWRCASPCPIYIDVTAVERVQKNSFKLWYWNYIILE
jgi:hypothetical protein